MNIVSHLKETLSLNLQKFMNDYMVNVIKGFNNPYSIDAYQQFADSFDQFTTNLNKGMFEAFIRHLDESFMQSDYRKKNYESKGFLSKNILTKFGFIELKRRRYIHKKTKEPYNFVDLFLGIQKYKRMDVFVIGELCEEASANSYAKAGKIVSKQIGSKIKYDDNPNKYIISRATARNNVISASKIMFQSENENYKNDIEELNIMIDEKFVPSQFNDNKDHMIKAAVVYENTKLEYKNRVRLTGKKVFGSVEDTLLRQVQDYIFYNYDTDKLNRINIMGDGAKWIQSFALDSSFKFHKDLIITYGLDHFHFAQAIQNITTTKNESLYEYLIELVYRNDKETFVETCSDFADLEFERRETINEKMNYITGNWQYIQNTLHVINYKCSMESNISHVFADIFTSRPKAYSKNGLIDLLNLRLLKVNGYDIKRTYLSCLKNEIKEKKTTEIINKVNIPVVIKDLNYTDCIQYTTYNTRISNALNHSYIYNTI